MFIAEVVITRGLFFIYLFFKFCQHLLKPTKLLQSSKEWGHLRSKDVIFFSLPKFVWDRFVKLIAVCQFPWYCNDSAEINTNHIFINETRKKIWTYFIWNLLADLHTFLEDFLKKYLPLYTMDDVISTLHILNIEVTA